MKIIISPAKKMIVDTDSLPYQNMPQFLHKAEQLGERLKSLSYQEAKMLWNCNDKIASSHYELLQVMDVRRSLTPAILAYDGIQYKYMAPGILETEQLCYIETHLRIVSGFYGLLCPFDGVIPYRLEMQAKLCGEGYRSLYEFWGDTLARQLQVETDTIINLASKEYSKCILPFLPEQVRFITCVFGELLDGKIVEKGTLCKMARGEMVRFMAENQIETTDQMQKFDRLGYVFSQELSDENRLVFIKARFKPNCSR